MNYIKSLVYNFFLVFFADYILPGVMVTSLTKLPHVGGDIYFAVALGILNSWIVPVLRLAKKEPTFIRIAILSLILNFACYGIGKFIPVGAHVMSWEGYVLVSVVVSIGSFLINFFEMRGNNNNQQNIDIPPPAL